MGCRCTVFLLTSWQLPTSLLPGKIACMQQTYNWNPQGTMGITPACLTQTLEKKDMLEIIHWINACVVLHNVLDCLGNAWDELHNDTGNSAGSQQNTNNGVSCDSENFCDWVKEKVLDFNYSCGTLPISCQRWNHYSFSKSCHNFLSSFFPF